MADLFPLTEQRRGLLQGLVLDLEPVDDQFAPGVLAWARKHELAAYNERVSPPRHQITELGRMVAEVDVKHGYTTRSRQLGGSPIRGLRGRIGTGVYCRCRWSWTTNEDPRDGGLKRVRDAWRRHAETVLAGLVADRG